MVDEWLMLWCIDNNLLLNTAKTKVVIVDKRKKKTFSHYSLTEAVKSVS